MPRPRQGEGEQEVLIREKDGKVGRIGGGVWATCVVGLRYEQVLASGAFSHLLP